MVLLRKEEYPEIEPGEYVAQVVEVKETVSKRNPQFGTSIRFAFRLLEQPFVNAVVSGLASAKLLAGNKLDKWLSGLGYEIEVGGNLDTDKLVGKVVRVVVDRDEGSKYTNVKHIYPLRDKDRSRIDPVAKMVSGPTSITQAPVASQQESRVAITSAPVQVSPDANSSSTSSETASISQNPASVSPRNIPF